MLLHTGIGGFAPERIRMDLTWNRVCNSTGMSGVSVGFYLGNQHINLDIKGTLLYKRQPDLFRVIISGINNVIYIMWCHLC